MAHNLATNEDGSAKFVSLRENPWHGLGTVINEEVSGAEMLKLAGLDYTIHSAPVFAEAVSSEPAVDSDGNMTSIDRVIRLQDGSKKMIYRGDNNEVLGTVGADYEIYQNSEIISFFDGLVAGHQITYETAGALGNGSRVWVLASIPELTMAINGDEHKRYMQIRTGHDGSMALACHPTDIRVVCQNTMNAANRAFINALRENRKAGRGADITTGYIIKHTRNMRDTVAKVQAAYAKVIEDFATTTELYKLLAGRPVTNAEVIDYFKACLKIDDEKVSTSKRGATRASNRLDELNAIYESPTNQTANRNTAYAAMQTVVEWIDHARGTRCTTEGKSDAACRFESANFGSGANEKQRAMELALALV